MISNEETIEQALANIMEKCRATAFKGDTYTDENGILYCAKCRTPREVIINGLTLYGMCDCQSQEYRKQQEEERKRLYEEAVKALKQKAFPPNTLYPFWTFANSDDNDTELIATAKAYVSKFQEFKVLHKGLLLFGTKGSGKSYIAGCIANALLERGRKVYMTNFSRISNDIQSSFTGRNEYVDELCSADLLIIDDFMSERKTEYMNEIVFTVIDARYNTGLPLIVTTNLTAAEIKQYDNDRDTARIMSRLLEMCHPVEVKGEDRRKERLKSDYADISKMLHEKP